METKTSGVGSSDYLYAQTVKITNMANLVGIILHLLVMSQFLIGQNQVLHKTFTTGYLLNDLMIQSMNLLLGNRFFNC